MMTPSLLVPLLLLLLTPSLGKDGNNDDDDGGLVWEDLSLTADPKGDATILHPFSGRVPAGQVCGLLGPSGAGKTSFMSALADRTSSLVMDGQVYSYHPPTDDDADDVQELYQRIPHHSVAWLQQHDDFFTMLTAQETLRLAAFLELPHLSQTAREELVQDQLRQLGLSGVAHRRVGEASSMTTSARLSGGERRRLAVALELLTEKQLLLADEVSGMSTTTTEHITSSLTHT